MAKSKLVQANAHIAERVTGAFAAVQDTVVSSYTKVEDAFVNAFLEKEDDGDATEGRHGEKYQLHIVTTIRYVRLCVAMPQ